MSIFLLSLPTVVTSTFPVKSSPPANTTKDRAREKTKPLINFTAAMGRGEKTLAESVIISIPMPIKNPARYRSNHILKKRAIK